MVVQIWLKENGKDFCVIEDCYGLSPLALIADLKRLDKLDGTEGGKYYIKRIEKGKLPT